MPSFLKFVSRMIKGEPVYQQVDDTQQPLTESAPAAVGPKIIPQVMITRSECRIKGQRMNCSADITNTSNQPIFLDEIHIFGVKHELQRQFKPGEERELEIYDGPTVQGRFVDECYLLYRNDQGDYFRSQHHVDCEQQADGSQHITRIRFLPPVKNV